MPGGGNFQDNDAVVVHHGCEGAAEDTQVTLLEQVAHCGLRRPLWSQPRQDHDGLAQGKLHMPHLCIRGQPDLAPVHGHFGCREVVVRRHVLVKEDDCPRAALQRGSPYLQWDASSGSAIGTPFLRSDGGRADLFGPLLPHPVARHPERVLVDGNDLTRLEQQQCLAAQRPVPRMPYAVMTQMQPFCHSRSGMPWPCRTSGRSR